MRYEDLMQIINSMIEIVHSANLTHPAKIAFPINTISLCNVEEFSKFYVNMEN